MITETALSWDQDAHILSTHLCDSPWQTHSHMVSSCQQLFLASTQHSKSTIFNYLWYGIGCNMYWWLGTWTLNFILIVETLWHSNVSVEYCKLLCLCPMPSIVSIGILSSPSNTSEINFYVYFLSEFFPFLCVFCDKPLPAIESCSRYKSSKSSVWVAILQQWN